jgi:hypothetical protein
MLSVIILSVAMLNVVMIGVMAPPFWDQRIKIVFKNPLPSFILRSSIFERRRINHYKLLDEATSTSTNTLAYHIMLISTNTLAYSFKLVIQRLDIRIGQKYLASTNTLAYSYRMQFNTDFFRLCGKCLSCTNTLAYSGIEILNTEKVFNACLCNSAPQFEPIL